ncbi:hypothetical protein BK144_02855 [Paenibacillus sp. FSL R7-0273]|nr:hypothetical protein BK144_02855 [Paenibacillus sp. FSL R7-0273]
MMFSFMLAAASLLFSHTPYPLAPTVPAVYEDITVLADSSAEDGARKAVMSIAETTVSALKNQDFKVLQQLAHPQKGVRFSPYANIDVKRDILLSGTEIGNGFNNAGIYEWGAYDGTGDPIRLTFKKYYERFIFNRDYSKPDKVSYNQIVQTGNVSSNIEAAYPGSSFVEYSFSKGADGNDLGWSSLRLVYEKYKGCWYLSGIVHDEWTT